MPVGPKMITNIVAPDSLRKYGIGYLNRPQEDIGFFRPSHYTARGW